VISPKSLKTETKNIFAI
jgi:protein HOOK3